jgi:hypothetical protein
MLKITFLEDGNYKVIYNDRGWNRYGL